MASGISSWCHIKFLTDQIVSNVSTSFFKVLVEGTLSDPRQLKVGEVYKVFWSPDSEETPMDVVNSGNVILDVDDLPKLEKQRRAKRKEAPLKGYFNALLLDLRNSEDSFEDMGRVKTRDCKRVQIPSQKAIEFKTGKAASNSSASKSSTSKKAKKNIIAERQQVKMAAEAASANNIMALLSKCGSKSKVTRATSSKLRAAQELSHKSTNEDCDPDYEVSMDSESSSSAADCEGDMKEADIHDPDYWKNKYLEAIAKPKNTKRKKEKKRRKVSESHISLKHHKGSSQETKQECEKDSSLVSNKQPSSTQDCSQQIGNNPKSPNASISSVTYSAESEDVMPTSFAKPPSKYQCEKDGFFGSGEQPPSTQDCSQQIGNNRNKSPSASVPSKSHSGESEDVTVTPKSSVKPPSKQQCEKDGFFVSEQPPCRQDCLQQTGKNPDVPNAFTSVSHSASESEDVTPKSSVKPVSVKHQKGISYMIQEKAETPSL